MKKIIFVPTDKLIAIDSAIGLLMELKDKGFIVTTILRHFNLSCLAVQKNSILRLALDEIGGTRCFDRSKFSFRIYLYAYLFFMSISGAILLRNGEFLGAKGNAILDRLFRGRILEIDSDAYDQVYPSFDRVYFEKEVNSAEALRVDGSIKIHLSTKPRKGLAGSFYVGNPRARLMWQAFISRMVHSADFQSLIERIAGRKVIFFPLTYFGYIHSLEDRDTIKKFFELTIKTISENILDVYVIFKPHVHTDIKLVESILLRYKIHFEVSYLHPSILLRVADCCISNIYSTVQCDAKSMGVPTIEFTHYNSKYLSITQGRSQGWPYIDFFINRDPSHFLGCLEEVLRADFREGLSCDVNFTDIGNLLSHLNSLSRSFSLWC